MTHLIRFSDEAFLEYQEALEWHFGQRPGLEAEFQLAIDAALARIAESPRLFPPVGRRSPAGCRSCLVHRFPYSIMFRETETSIRVLAVAHHKRRPRYWYKRH